MSAPFRYSVLLASQGDFKHSELGRALSKYKGIPLQDAARLARHAWGFAGEDMEKGEAQRLIEALKAEGLSAKAIPSNLIEDMPVAVTVSKGEIGRDGFRVMTKDGRGTSLGWPSLAVIASAAFPALPAQRKKPEVKEKRPLGFLRGTAAMSSLSGERREKGPPPSSPISFHLELCQRKPIRRFRIDADHFDYSCLGPDMGMDALGNFRKLMKRLLREAPGSLINQGTRLLIDGAAVAKMGYESLKDLDREVTWLLTLETLRDPG